MFCQIFDPEHVTFIYYTENNNIINQPFLSELINHYR